MWSEIDVGDLRLQRGYLNIRPHVGYTSPVAFCDTFLSIFLSTYIMAHLCFSATDDKVDRAIEKLSEFNYVFKRGNAFAF